MTLIIQVEYFKKIPIICKSMKITTKRMTGTKNSINKSNGNNLFHLSPKISACWLFKEVSIHYLCNHSHKKRKDSLETRGVFSWTSMLTWNFGGGPSDSTSTFFKMKSAYGIFPYDNDFHAVKTVSGCYIC